MTDQQLWAIELVDVGRKKIPVIKALRDEFRYGLKQAKDLAEQGGVIATGLTTDRADRVLETLSTLGATAQRVDAGTVPEMADPNYDRLSGRVKASVAENLRQGESVLVVIRGAHSQAIVGTASRCFVCKPGFMAGATFGTEVSSWSYRNIVGVQVHKGFLSGAVIIQAPGQTGTKTNYWGKGESDPAKAPNAIPVAGDWTQVRSGVARLRELIDSAHAESPQASTSPSSIADELQKLSDLHKSGVLSETEFSAAKQRLLGT